MLSPVRLSVCLSVTLSPVCRLSSVTLVHRTRAVVIFGNISIAFGTLATHPLKKLHTAGVAKYSDFGPIEGYISETMQDRR